MNSFNKYTRKPDETIYQTLANICGKSLIDFEAIDENNYFVLKQGNDAANNKGVYCVRISFNNQAAQEVKKKKVNRDGSQMFRSDGSLAYEVLIEYVSGYYIIPEYSPSMGKFSLPERLYNKLTDYTHNTLEKRSMARDWRARQYANIQAKRGVKLRVGDILQLQHPMVVGDEKRGEPKTIVTEIKCLSINPLRFARVVLNGCMEEYDGSYYISRVNIAQHRYEYLERGKPLRKKTSKQMGFDEQDHLHKIAEAIAIAEATPNPDSKKKPRKRRSGAIGEDKRDKVLKHNQATGKTRLEEENEETWDFAKILTDYNDEN